MPEPGNPHSSDRRKLYRAAGGLVLRAVLGALAKHLISELWK